MWLNESYVWCIWIYLAMYRYLTCCTTTRSNRAPEESWKCFGFLSVWYWSTKAHSCGKDRNLLDKAKRWTWRDSTLVVLVHHSSFSVLQDDNAFCCRLFSDNQLRKWYSHVCTYHTTFQMKLLWILMGVHDEVCNHTATGSTSKWRNSQQQIASIFFSIPNYYIQYHMRRVSHYYYTLFLLTFSLHTYVHT